MKETDLMLDNILYDDRGKIYHVDYLTKKNKGGILKPIAITQDWLIKLGFTIDDLIVEKTAENGFRFVLMPPYKNQRYYHFVVLQNSAEQIILVKTVHQLQIMYFAITGDHLKLPKKKKASDDKAGEN